MDDIDGLIYGERPEDLKTGLRLIFRSGVQRADGRYQCRADLTGREGLPLLRAIYRAEAELLLEEALGLEASGGGQRTQAERQGVAVGRIAERMPWPAAS